MSNLPLKDEIDFCFLLALLPTLKGMPEYACLPELFSIVGHEKLIELCKYAGGESIKIPTLEELSESIQALKWYYMVFVEGLKSIYDIPEEYKAETMKIFEHTARQKC